MIQEVGSNLFFNLAEITWKKHSPLPPSTTVILGIGLLLTLLPLEVIPWLMGHDPSVWEPLSLSILFAIHLAVAEKPGAF